MCGVAGIWAPGSGIGGVELHDIARRMSESLAYRGPDDSGIWVQESAGLAFGHRRLSILDLSAEGHQPMASPGLRYVISYNGEVYNSAELRRELEPAGFRFRGHSDTEVMLAAFEAWGVEEALHRFIGMFAFALWDRERRELHLVRDRLGIKPLYYGWVNGRLLFGSELKALRSCPGFDVPIHRGALALYLRYNYVPAPYSIYRGVHKLPPGQLLTITEEQVARRVSTEDLAKGARTYWSARQVATEGINSRFTGSDSEAAETLENLLRDSVALRMMADVPLGAFLSGGVDSSTVVALMQAQSPRPIRTFSIGFHEDKYNEAGHAARVARHLGTDHTELYVTAGEAQAVIPSLPQMFDEPFADSSQIPTFLVSRLARNAVTVSLSGDGGDELFAGYDRYFRTLAIWGKVGRLPAAGRRALAAALKRSPDGLLKFFALMAGTTTRAGTLSPDRMRKLGGMVSSPTAEALYRELLSHWREPSSAVIGAEEPDHFLARPTDWRVSEQLVDNMCLADLSSYLPDDILTKVDRASMAVSLEARVPILDHRVVEFASRLPLRMKIRDGQSKWLLRQVLYRHVPRELIDRPKMGFGVPIDEWLRGPLRDWAEALLSEERLRREGFLDPGPIRAKWREHLSGQRRWHYHLWDVLMFQAWWEQSGAARPAAPADGIPEPIGHPKSARETQQPLRAAASADLPIESLR